MYRKNVRPVHSKEDRPAEISKIYEEQVNTAKELLGLIDKCVAIKAKERPQDVAEIENLLAERPLPKPEPIQETSGTKENEAT